MASLLDNLLGLVVALSESAVARIVGSNTLVTAAVGSTGEGSAGSDTVGGGTTKTGVTSSETSDGAELGITESVLDLATSVLDASLWGVVELVKVTVATSDSAGQLNVSGVVGIVGDITLVIDELSAVIVVVGTVVPGSEGVGPAAISEVGTVGISVRVGSWGIAEGVSAEADGVADVARGVLVTLVAEASLLLAEVVIVVAGDGVEGDVDLSGVVAPLVINRFLGVEVIIGSPLVPCVVNPLVVALALVADLSVGVVVISNVPLLLLEGATEGTATFTVTTDAVTSIATADAVTTAVARTVGEAISVTFGALVAVVLVVGTISLRLDSIVVGSLPGIGSNDSGGEKNGLEHFKF